jgi:hypothetical protein
VQFTEDWFAYDDAVAMRRWLEEAIRTELFGPTFENSGPWQLMKSSRRDWIAPQASRRVSEESEQSSALTYDNPPRIRGSPHSWQSNSATEHMDTHMGVQEGNIVTDGSPARSKTEKQLEMEGHRDFIQECAIEDEEWKWSPVYLLLRDFFGLSAYLPRPWKHTTEEWHLVHKFIQAKFRRLITWYIPSGILIALQCTWKLHFSANITDLDLNTLSQQLEHVSQDKEFVSNLSRVQDLMRRRQWGRGFALGDLVWEGISESSIRSSRKQQILANDIASFKAPSETPGHQDVMKRVCNHLSAIAGHAMPVDDPENFKDMWIRGYPKNKQEMLIKKWKSSLYQDYLALYARDVVTLR